MRALRLAFLLVAVVFLLPGGLLVRRAYLGADAEEQARRRDVAELRFREIERELTALLEQEEARSFAEYRHLYLPENQLQALSVAAARSPLADLPTQPWVLGYFQVDLDGSVHTPLVPTAAERDLAGAALVEAPSPEAVRRDAEIKDLLDRHLRRPLMPPEQLIESHSLSQGPGTTRQVGKPPAQKKSRAKSILETTLGRSDRKKSRSPQRKVSSAYNVEGFEQGVNQSVLDRNSGVLQQDDLQVSRDASWTSARGAPAPAAAEESRYEAKQELEDLEQVRGETNTGLNGRFQSEPSGLDDDIVFGGRLDESARDFVQAIAPVRLEVLVDPFHGQLAGSDRLILVRSIFVESRSYRQGFILDLPALQAWLLGRLAPAAADVDWHVGLTAPPMPATEGSAYRHRFAEPFGTLWATTVVLGASSFGGRQWVVLLSVLAVLGGGLGLLAAYRMVMVTVAFADRRNDFVSAVTHELKTPLTAIRLYSEMLLQGVATSEPKQRQYHQTIHAESERLTRLVENVLELARLEKGTRSLQEQVGPVDPVLRELTELLGPHVQEQGFELVVEIEPDLPSVKMDRDALLQVLMNLVENALKYSKDADEKVITLSAAREGERVAVRVGDRGPGVPTKQLRHVFEPFRRLDPELTRRAKGTGLGLALVKGLVDLMGGRVEGRNLEPSGFEVSVTLQAAA
ncbi:MAG: HAMP domain-containing sensor histidine kinase [Acidobacteriota bacterium]